jgi:hypothetical protein
MTEPDRPVPAAASEWPGWCADFGNEAKEMLT